MKNYRLIKKYPSLPKDWVEGMIVGIGDNRINHYYSPCNGKYKDFYIQKEEIENNTKFWEEVITYPVGTKVIGTHLENKGRIYEKIENGFWKINNTDYIIIPEFSIGEGKRYKLVEEKLDYEILTIISGVTTLKVNHKFDWVTGGGTINYHLSRGDKIHSVKRLNDGKIFTVGDFIGKGSDFFIIYSFTIRLKDKVCLVSSKEHNYICNINELKHYEFCLLTTEDGVDLYKNDTAFLVEYTPSLCNLVSTVNLNANIKNFYYRHKFFSTKEKAEEYILYNKPVLSLNDITKVFKKLNNVNIENLEQLVKNKNL